MGVLVAGLIVFLGAHALPMAAALRSSLRQRLGAGAYRLLFSLVSLVGLAMIVLGKGQAPFVHVYDPPAWGRAFAGAMMLPALVLLPAAHMPGNIKRFTRHPMLWAVVAWSVGHLAANGDLASLLMFGGFGLYALLDMASANLRGARLASARAPLGRDLAVVAAGLIAYALLRYLHPYLFGVSPG